MARSPQFSPQAERKTLKIFKEKWRDNKESWRYYFDKSMAAGLKSQLGLLGLVILVLVSLSAILLMFTGIRDLPQGNLSFGEAVWQSLMHAMDTGTVGADTDIEFRAVMIVVSVIGVVLMASLIGVINNALTENMTRLRKGRSPVREKDYTLILGWSPAIFNVVRELVKANEKRSGPNKAKWRVVIMADEDKVKMEDEIRAKLRKAHLQRHNYRVICRTGNPIDVDDLNIVRPRQARSVLILSPQADDHDSHVIKTILAVQHTPRHSEDKTGEETTYIVCGLDNARDNKSIADLVCKERAGLGKVHLMDSGDVIARIIAQTCRQAGMSEIYTDLLEYDDSPIHPEHDDSHIYLKKVEPALVGKTFEEALLMLPNASLIGIERGDEILLNPLDNEKTRNADDRKIRKDDSIIVVATSKTFVTVGSCEPIAEDAIQKPGQNKPKPEKTLILGWNKRGYRILDELNSYVESGSQVTVVAAKTNFDETKWQCAKEVNQSVEFCQGDPTKRDTLNSLNIGEFDHIIVLGDHDLPPQQADMNTLVTLLNLRDLKGQTACSSLSIVSEMLVESNRKLAENIRDNNSGGHDFIIGYKLISSYLTQISQREKLQAVFEELLTEKGMEIYLKPAESYVKLDKEVKFSTIVASAARHKECAIGYRISSQHHEKDKNYGVKINPTKSASVEFKPGDRIIVVAEEEWEKPSTGDAVPVTSD